MLSMHLDFGGYSGRHGDMMRAYLESLFGEGDRIVLRCGEERYVLCRSGKGRYEVVGTEEGDGDCNSRILETLLPKAVAYNFDFSPGKNAAEEHKMAYDVQ